MERDTSTAMTSSRSVEVCASAEPNGIQAVTISDAPSEATNNPSLEPSELGAVGSDPWRATGDNLRGARDRAPPITQPHALATALRPARSFARPMLCPLARIWRGVGG